MSMVGPAKGPGVTKDWDMASATLKAGPPPMLVIVTGKIWLPGDRPTPGTGGNGLFSVTLRIGRRMMAVPEVVVALLFASFDSKQTLPGSAIAVALMSLAVLRARTRKVAVSVSPGHRKNPGPPRQATSKGRPMMRVRGTGVHANGAEDVALTKSTSLGTCNVRLTQLQGALPALRAVTVEGKVPPMPARVPVEVMPVTARSGPMSGCADAVATMTRIARKVARD